MYQRDRDRGRDGDSDRDGEGGREGGRRGELRGVLLGDTRGDSPGGRRGHRRRGLEGDHWSDPPCGSDCIRACGRHCGYEQALDAAKIFLSRWTDRFTHNARDDIAQEAVIETWRRRRQIRDPSRLEAFVRTVARRIRSRSVERHLRVRVESIHDPGVRDLVVDERHRRRRVRAFDAWVEAERVIAGLDDVLVDVTSLNRCLVEGYYSGFSCSELADRYDLAQEHVKARLYRGRVTIRKGLELRVCPAEQTP